jgi:hypothetical protein
MKLKSNVNFNTDQTLNKLLGYMYVNPLACFEASHEGEDGVKDGG